MHSRREFLGTLGRSAVGAALFGRLRSPMLEGRGGAPRTPIGIQLYTVRDLLKRDFEGTLAALAGIGYREVEFAGYFDHTPTQIRAALQRHNLAAPATHIPLPANDSEWQRTLDQANAIGHRWVIVAWLDEPLRRTPDDWKRLADRFNHLGRLSRRAGLRFAHHTYDSEFTPQRGTTMFTTLLQRTDPAVVDFELDVYWAVKGAADPLALIRRNPGRFPLLHLKDATAAPERRMVDVGAGTIDWVAILAADRATLEHAFVEHDEPADALASARASYSYLSRLRY